MGSRRCDRYQTCGQEAVDRGGGTLSDEQLRIRGWRVWSGTDHLGRLHAVVLCEKCGGSTKRPPLGAPLEGQEELF